MRNNSWQGWTEQRVKELLDKGTIQGYRVVGGGVETESAKLRAPKKKKKASKYNNEKVEADGKVFDSKHEYEVYTVLKFRQMAGEISELKTQAEFLLVPKQGKERAVKYIADFSWIENGELKVGDAKSEATRKLSTYVMKRKLMLQKFNIQIIEL